MKRIDDASHAAWHAEAALQQSRVLSPAFQGTVTGLKGTPGAFQVQVLKTGEKASDGHWYAVEANGSVPVIGDRVQLQWVNDQIAFVTGVLSTPRAVDQHNLHCRLYYTGSSSFAPGWSRVPFNNVSEDLSGMNSSGTVVIPLRGRYEIILHSGAGAGGSLIAGIYLNSVLYGRGSSATSGESLAADVLSPLNPGDRIEGWIFVSSTSALVSGADSNFMTVNCLQAM